MEVLVEFIKAILTNPEVVGTTLTVTIVIALIWFVYQTIRDTNVRKRSNKYRKSFIGQLITGKSKDESQQSQNNNIRSGNSRVSSHKNTTVDNAIIKALRQRRYLDKSLEVEMTSRGYSALETFKDLRKILEYSGKIKASVESLEGNIGKDKIASFHVEVIDKSVTIYSETIPPMKMTTTQAKSISGIDDLKGIVNDNRILSAFAYDTH
ncbi:hypothetical protein Q0P22_13775 [Staphylococcus aureus]|nr:hypothetical protein [Staphylococcus aureus]MDN8977692.1 hypothetical protein [Staphylococcus aureus]